MIVCELPADSHAQTRSASVMHFSPNAVPIERHDIPKPPVAVPKSGSEIEVHPSSEVEVHQHPSPPVSRERLAEQVLRTAFVFDLSAEIGRAQLYAIYHQKVGEIAPQTKPLSRQAFFAVVRETVPDVNETHHRVKGTLQRFFTGIGCREETE